MELETTFVGSYPVPEWLPLRPTEEPLLDATAVVISAQERAGIDLVTDGELSWFDPDRAVTNGMIDFFGRRGR